MIWLEDALADYDEQRAKNLEQIRPLLFEVIDDKDLWCLTNKPEWVKLNASQYPMTFKATMTCGGMMKYQQNATGRDYYKFNIDKLKYEGQ